MVYKEQPPTLSISCANDFSAPEQRLGDEAAMLGTDVVQGESHRARRQCATFASMIDKRFFDELNDRISEAFRNSPAQDIEKNLKALLASGFARLDLVLREDFEVQQKLLERAQAKLAELEARVAELESKRGGG
jgi:ubiquinone biosynthesis accessory factor UbiK